MGGSYWDDGRDYIPVPTPTDNGATSGIVPYSSTSDEVFQRNAAANPDMLAINRNLACANTCPIVLAVDVTGSMGNWIKVIYDKLPMFFGQLMVQGYLDDPAISFCCVGDANSDQYPLQVSEFGSGSILDQYIEQMCLEGGGGSQAYETYELAAYFYARRVEFLSTSRKPFFFFTGDEAPYPVALADHIFDHIGGDEKPLTVSTKELFRELRSKYHVFCLRKPFFDQQLDKKMQRMWEDLIGAENVIMLSEPKAIVDVMLGAIALVSGTRSMDRYQQDLLDRGQDEHRLAVVKCALQSLSMSASAAAGTVEGGNAGEIAHALENARVAYRNFLKSVNPDDELESAEIIRLQQQLEAIRLAEGIEMPDDYLCPITQEAMRNPVMTADGHSYERKAIEQWLESHDTSPATNEVLKKKKLIPNTTLKRAIDDFLEKYGTA